jgi:hypothetical protein
MLDDDTSSIDDEEDAAVPHVPLRELDKYEAAIRLQRAVIQPIIKGVRQS